MRVVTDFTRQQFVQNYFATKQYHYKRMHKPKTLQLFLRHVQVHFGLEIKTF